MTGFWGYDIITLTVDVKLPSESDALTILFSASENRTPLLEMKSLLSPLELDRPGAATETLSQHCTRSNRDSGPDPGHVSLRPRGSDPVRLLHSTLQSSTKQETCLVCILKLKPF